MDLIAQAIGIVFQPLHLLLLLGSVFMGILVGAAPGLTPTMAIGLLIPATYAMSGYAAFIMLLGIYCGGIYGGSITAILLNVPSTPTSAITAIEGYPMTLKGEGGRALGMAAMASAIGGLFSCIVLIFLSMKLAKVATIFGGPEYFCLGLFATTVVFSLTGASVVKGLIAVCLGLLFSEIGMDLICANPRFTFGIPELMMGVPSAPAIIGLLCVSEVFRLAEQSEVSAEIKKGVTGILAVWRELPGLWWTILKSSVIGVCIGILPATGATMASLMAYGEAKRSSKHPEKFGTGVIEGVCASETANNAVTGGALIPLLTLGIPGDTNTLMMMGAMFIHGLVPGPTLFREQATLIYVIYVAMIASNLLILPFGLSMSKQIAKYACLLADLGSGFAYLRPRARAVALADGNLSRGRQGLSQDSLGPDFPGSRGEHARLCRALILSRGGKLRLGAPKVRRGRRILIS